MTAGTCGEWKEKKHPTFHEILRVFVKIAAALAYMHSLGILHRDLKLVNVLIRKSDGEPIIIDFSCATYAQAAELTESGLPPGTDRFRAPEQFKYLREHREEHRKKYAFQVADEIFAVGAMLYELLTDARPTEVRPRETLNNPGGKVYVWPEKLASGRPGRVFVKYERVKLPRQDEVPVCFVVDVEATELKDGTAKTWNENQGFVTDAWQP